MFEAGGVPMLLKTLLDGGFINGDCLTVTGKSMAENLKNVKFNDDQDAIFEDFAISDKTIVNIGNRDFVDYRPTSEISNNILKNNSVSNVNFD